MGKFTDMGTKIIGLEVQIGVLKVGTLRSAHDTETLKGLAARAQTHAADVTLQVAKYTDATERAKYLAGCVDAGVDLLKTVASKLV